jgi:hypothetical protein
MNHPETPFTFDANTEQSLFNLSNQILRSKGENTITGTNMADTGQMQAIADALGVSFVHAQTAATPLLRQGSEMDPYQDSVRQSITNEAVIIGGRGLDADMDSNKVATGEDHFSLYLPKDTQLFQAQLESLKEPY